MCGIAGVVQKGIEPKRWESTLTSMINTLTHRGPDDAGLWYDAKIGMGLGHRRLSIIDLSYQSRQPMLSRNGRYCIAYNGEVYNFRELKKELQSLGHTFRSQSDTEVMLVAIEQWGLLKALKRFNGMFVFALWDQKTHTLHLVRDRLGMKPLYYGWLGKTFVFSSELKALRVHDEFTGKINRNALALMMRYNCIPAPYSIYEGIYKLLPGHIISLNKVGEEPVHSIVSYWTAKDVAEDGIAHPFKGEESEAEECLDVLLKDAVKQHMISDVPLGAFLSGGVDSSLVVALMQAQSDIPVKTFTIGFHESEYNEAEDAKEVARHIGTDHTEFYVTPEEAIAVVPRLPILYDEPFSDSSQIPTFLVSELAKKHVTVSLSGDGGDELFGGYNRHIWVPNIWRKVGWIPVFFRGMLSRGIKALPPRTWEIIWQKLTPFLPQIIRLRNPGDKLHKLADVIASENPTDMYYRLVSHWEKPTDLVIGAIEPPTVLTEPSRWANLSDFNQQMMFLDLISYLPDDGFTKVDRASMGVGLEARLPLLDHRIVEFAWKLPMSMKIKNGNGKWILRQILYRYVPKEFIERPKTGFALPIDMWLRGPLRDWAESLLDERRLREEGFFFPQSIRQRWNEHLRGRHNWQHHLWDVLMFQAWKEYNDP